MENFNKRVARGFAWEGGTRIVVQVVSWVSTIWIARILAPEDYGLVAISGIFTGLCLTISVMGLGDALINRKDLTENDKAIAFCTTTLLSILFYITLYFSAPVVADIYESEELILLIRVAAIIVLISPLSVVSRALSLRALLYKERALITMFSNLIITVLALVLAFSGAGFWSLVISTLVGQLFEMFALFYLVRYVPMLPKNWMSARSLYKYSLNVMGARLVAYLNIQWPAILISSFFGKVQTGNYQMANNLASAPILKVGEVFTKVAFPAFAKIQSDTDRAKNVFLKMHGFFFTTISPMLIGIALVASDLIPLLLGEKWIDIVVLIQIICIASIFLVGTLLIPTLLEGLGNAGASFHYQVVVAILSPLAMLAGANWGMTGIVIGWAAVVPIGYFYLLVKLKGCVNISFLEILSNIKYVILGVLVMIACNAIFNQFIAKDSLETVVTISLEVILGFVSYASTILLVDRASILALVNVVKGR